MKTLVYIEHSDGDPRSDSLGVLQKASTLGTAHAIVCGAQVPVELAETLGGYGAEHVVVAEDPLLAGHLPGPHLQAVAEVFQNGGYDTLFLATSILATDIAGGLAVQLSAGLNWDLTDVHRRDGELVGVGPVLADSAYVEAGWTTPIRIATFRPGSCIADRAPAAGPSVARVRPDLAGVPNVTAQRVETTTDSGGRRLSDARVIVAAGRGLSSPHDLKLVADLATALGGAPAVTMPLVTDGLAPYSMQVGQTGSIVRPNLYLAFGVSGQVQHKVGMEQSANIISVNTDASAPIVGFCDLAVVADARQVLERLVQLTHGGEPRPPAA